MSQKHMIIPVFVPHKGCPFDCIYCNQKLISGQTEEITVSKLNYIVDEHLKYVSDKTHIEIGFYGGSFTGIDKTEQIMLLNAANKYVLDGKVNGIRLSTRPDYISREILEYLKFYNVKTIELGVQSMDPDVLRISCRGHGVNEVITSSHIIKEYGLNLGIQTMVGLPGDSYDSNILTASQVIGLKPDIVRIYPVLVIKGTYLESMYHNGDYMPLSLNSAVDICAELLDMYESNNINVIRVGLQPTENINNNMDVVAGPFHAAFRQLVEAQRFLKKMIEAILNCKLHENNEITIYVKDKFTSLAVGQKRHNIEYLKNRFDFKNIKIIIDNEMTEDFRIL